MAPRVWFITGASSGFGYEAVKIALENGEIAVATLRNPSKSPQLAELAAKYPDRSLILQFDTTKPETVRPTFEKAIEKFGRIDVVFNNAGVAMSGEAEGTTLEVAKGLYEVNVWGVVTVSLEAVRVFREVNPKTGPIGGLLFQSSSTNGGFLSWPGAAFYASTKGAINSFSESLSAEVDPDWHITISAVQWGYFYTKALDNSIKAPPHPAYGTHLPSHQIRAFATSGNVPGGAESSDAIEALYKVSKRDPKDIPLLLAMGMDSVKAARQSAEARSKAADIGEEISKHFPVRQ